MYRSILIALGLLFASWGCALYAAVHEEHPHIASVEIGEPVILHAEVVNAD